MSSVAPCAPPTPPPTRKRPASREIDVTSIQRRPRAVVILYGWLGAEYNTLKKYAQIYQDRGCCTVCATAPPLALLSGSRSYLREVAIASCREASMLIRKGEMSEMGFGSVPLVIHAFSNGGAFLLSEVNDIVAEDGEVITSTDDFSEENENERGRDIRIVSEVPSWSNKSQRNLMSWSVSGDATAAGDQPAMNDLPSASTDDTEDLHKSGSYDLPSPPSISPRPTTRSWGSKRKCPRVKRTDSERKILCMKEAKRPHYNSEQRAYRQDMALVASRLRLGTLIFDSGPCFVTLSSGLQAARHGVRNPFLRAASSLALIGGYTVSKLLCSRVGLFGTFWNNMMNNSLTPRQAYIYSDADAVCDSEKLGELIKYREATMGNDVSVLKFTDSPHVMHMRYHRHQYESFVEKQLDAVAAKVEEDEGELTRALRK